MPFYRWTTFQDLVALQERMNRIVEDAIRRGNLGTDDREPGHWVPPCDLFETADGLELRVELAGVGLEDIDLQVSGERLVLRGTRHTPENAPSEAFARMERTYGPFRREFQLPPGLSTDATSAEFHDGVLFVRIPKSRRASTRTVPVARTGEGAQG